jgi:hypothetical protein
VKTHGSLGIARIAVRQSANAGEGFWELHGLLGYLKKLFHATVIRGRQALQAGIKNFRNMLCIRAISPNPMPSKHLRRTPCCATYSGEPQPGPAIPALQGDSGRTTGVQPGHLWGCQLPPCPSARPAKRIPPECMGNAIYGPTGANFKEHPCTNINNMLPSIRVSAQTYTRRQYNAHSYTIT